MPIGPQLPPSAEKRKRSHDEDNSDSDDEVGPQLPPSTAVESKSKKPRTIGPSLPPTLAPKEPLRPEDKSDSDDDDDDDDFGPALPLSNTTKENSINNPKPMKQTRSNATPPSQPQVVRDEWMTMAPKSGDWSQRVDPTKLKSRKFNTGRSSNPATSSSDGASWHETPEQKQARLQRQVLGTKDKDGGGGVASSAENTSTEDLETARRMKEYNKERGPSLYQAHQKKHQDDADDDPSARAFDREKDMGAGLQLNSTQRREMLKKSANFSSRFSSARYL